MRESRSYSFSEWLVLSPLVHRLKHVRDQRIEHAYRNLGAATRDRFIAENAQGLESTLAVTIAFNTPWVVDLFLRRARVNLPKTSVIVADNSANAQASAEISSLCSTYSTAYLRLPANPERHPSRSHGLAMNWVYYNLIRPLDPDVFAFLDHDLLALSPCDLKQMVARQPVYGYRRGDKVAWSLWAGYSIFNNAAVRRRDLDFSYERAFNLDTGGNNWERLYRFLDVDAITFAPHREVWFRDPADGSLHRCGLVDSFVHVLHASHAQDAGRIAFFRRLIGHVEGGGRWQDFLVPE